MSTATTPDTAVVTVKATDHIAVFVSGGIVDDVISLDGYDVNYLVFDTNDIEDDLAYMREYLITELAHMPAGKDRADVRRRLRKIITDATR